MNNPTLLKNLRVIPDFPIPGIQFQDVTTLFQDAECLRIMRDEIVDIYKDKGITKIVGIESRGFMLAGVVAAEIGAGVVMCRKPGKLPGETIKQSYQKEYGEDTIEIHRFDYRERRGAHTRRPPCHWRQHACSIRPRKEIQSEEGVHQLHHRTED